MRPVVLIILDGWGESSETKGNAIKAADKPSFDFIEKYFPLTLLQASGVAVGLAWGEQGNSEVGHIAMGTGQIWHQPLIRITLAIQNGSFFQNPTLLKAAQHAQKNNSVWHLVGLLGSGSVHSYIDHLYALLEFAKNQHISQVWLHIFTDGRDSPPKESAIAIQNLIERLNWLGTGKIASLIGRFYAMDRDRKWDRTEKAYHLLIKGEGEATTDFVSSIKKQYSQNITDEYMPPIVLSDADGAKPGVIKDNDAVIFFNYREDRIRQLAYAFNRQNFNEFTTKKFNNLFFATLVEYEPDLKANVIFPPIDVKHSLSKILSDAGLKQFKIAETQKYAHITYFFNGGTENPFPGEDRKLIPSLDEAYFNKVPEMKAHEIGEEMVQAIQNQSYDFLLANFANADMVGHTGDYAATIKAIEAIDNAVGKIMDATLAQNGVLMITADHGNAEQMLNPATGEISTEHTSNPVPFYLIMNNLKKEKNDLEINRLKQDSPGFISDVAATILDLMGIGIPQDMEGQSLLPRLYNQ
jgi:2,3-bisphosphoglycerate-independent phosphoglycerate mutase